MEKNRIIEDVLKSGLIDSLTTPLISYIGLENIEDFKQDMYLILLELPSTKLEELFNNKELDFYIISIARNQARNKKSKFNKLYNRDWEIPATEYIFSKYGEIEEDKDWN